jgi:hypothetical protein
MGKTYRQDRYDKTTFHSRSQGIRNTNTALRKEVLLLLHHHNTDDVLKDIPFIYDNEYPSLNVNFQN